jgi:hypothetical protein
MRDVVILFLHLIVTVVDVQGNDTKGDRVEIDPGEKRRRDAYSYGWGKSDTPLTSDGFTPSLTRNAAQLCYPGRCVTAVT